MEPSFSQLKMANIKIATHLRWHVCMHLLTVYGLCTSLVAGKGSGLGKLKCSLVLGVDCCICGNAMKHAKLCGHNFCPGCHIKKS